MTFSTLDSGRVRPRDLRVAVGEIAFTSASRTIGIVDFLHDTAGVAVVPRDAEVWAHHHRLPDLAEPAEPSAPAPNACGSYIDMSCRHLEVSAARIQHRTRQEGFRQRQPLLRAEQPLGPPQLGGCLLGRVGVA